MTQESIPLQLGEEIRPIRRYEGLYSITSYGQVWSHKRNKVVTLPHCIQIRKYKGIFKKLALCKNYVIITLSKNNKKFSYRVSRLVAQHFISNLLSLPEVNHKDGNKLNNYVDNLEWCEHQENINHAMLKKIHTPNRKNKFYGVRFRDNCGRKKKWYVTIRMGGKKRISMDYFMEEIEAAKAYNDYVIKYNLNRPLNML